MLLVSPAVREHIFFLFFLRPPQQQNILYVTDLLML